MELFVSEVYTRIPIKVDTKMARQFDSWRTISLGNAVGIRLAGHTKNMYGDYGQLLVCEWNAMRLT